MRLVIVASLAICGISQAAAPLSLGQRLLRSGELTGFAPLPQQTYRNALEWALIEGPGDATARQHWLEHDGFVAGAYEQLATPKWSSRSALSYVVQFRTAAEARADVIHELGNPANGAGVKVHAFSVLGIPGAHGLAIQGPSRRGYDVIFVIGTFRYGVSAFTVDAGKEFPTATQVAGAALRLYQRVRGAPASASAGASEAAQR